MTKLERDAKEITMNNVIASRTAARTAEPWDFNSRFPAPLSAALEAGLLCTREIDEEQIAALHEELAHEALGLLAELDRVADALRGGLDPRTGKPPRTDALRQELAAMLPALSLARDNGLEQVLAAYIDAFGLDAGCAFGRWLIATHRGVLIYVPATDRGPDLCAAAEQDTEARRDLLLADFERLMPGGEGAAWPAGQAIWNVEIVGPYDPEREPFYEPGHPFYYHLGGVPWTAAKIVVQTPALARERLLGDGRREPAVAYWRTRLADARGDLEAVVAMYDRLYREGPRASSEYDRSFGRGDATPVTRWGEMMAGGYRFVAFAAATVKGIEAALDAYPGGAARLAEAPARHEQMPLFG